MKNNCLKWNNKLRIGVVCTVVEGMLAGYNYMVLFQIIWMLHTNTTTMHSLISAAVSLAIMYLVRMLIYGYGYTQAQLGGAAVSRDIRLFFGEKMKKIPLSEFQQGQIGDYINISTNDVNGYEKILTHKVGDLAKGITLLTVILGIVSYLYLPAGLVLIVASLFLIPALYLSFHMVKKYGNQKNDISAEAVSSIVEYISGIQVFRAYGVGGIKNKVVTEALKRYSDINYVFEKKVIPISNGLNVIHGCCFPIVLYMGYQAYLSGSLDTVAFLLVAMMPIVFMKLCASIFVNLTSYKNLMISKNKILKIVNAPEEKGVHTEVNPKSYDIEFEHVNFGYHKDEPVLKDVSFCAKNHQLTAIVGDSGSGKSTILNLIAKYYRPDSGTISIGGQSILSIAPEEVLDKISILDQDVFLFNDSVKDNIRYARPTAKDAEIVQACKEANSDEFIRNMEKGYDTTVGENGSQLSGGERQRLSISRAILKNSPVLLLDEATSSLDIENELAVKRAITNLLKQQKTVIMIAHTLSIVRNADQILVLSKGQIVERGTHDSLLAKNGKYTAMWKAEQEISH